MPVSDAEFRALWSAAAHDRPEAAPMAAALLREHRDALSIPLVSGLMFLAEGKPRQAYAAFTEAAAAAPGDARGYYGLAQSLLRLGHPAKAIAAGQEALRLDPGFWPAMLAVADASDAMGRSADAIEEYRRIIALKVDAPVVHLGLGNTLQKLGRLAEASEQFDRAVALAPELAAGHCNLGNALMAMGRHQEAIARYRQALTLDSGVRPLLYTNLAQALVATGDFSGAEAESRAALALDPDFAEAHGVLAEALHKLQRYGEAIAHYRMHGTPESAAKALEDLYRLGDMAAFAAYQEELHQTQPGNIRLAAISVRAALEHGPQFGSRFCADPLRRIAVGNVAAALAPFDRFVAELLEQARPLDTVWEPPAKTTRGGFQTEGNIFELAGPAIARLKRVLDDGITAYFARQEGAGEHFVTHWPRELTLTGWIVRLRRQGRQGMHMHPDGWLSGVLYLQVPPLAPPQGALGFSLTGAYPGASQAPDFQHQPRQGELVLFPSSLFHYTVPFDGAEERVSLAFDLLPKKV